LLSLSRDLPQVHRQHHQRCQLAGERFRRRDHPISGPAWVRIVPAASRVIAEPATLQMAMVFESFSGLTRAVPPECRQFSPDWLMQMGQRFRVHHGVAVTEFAAIVHLNGGSWPGARIMNLPVWPACQLVPQATILMLLKLRNSALGDIHLNSRQTLLESGEMRSSSVSRNRAWLFQRFPFA